MKITGSKNRVSLVVGKIRCGVRVSAGPWIQGVDPNMIKLRAKSGCFPAEIKSALAVEDNSDSREDYFEASFVRLLPGHPLYEMAKASV